MMHIYVMTMRITQLGY